MQFVAAEESIFHKFIILQVFPEMDRCEPEGPVPARALRTPACDTLYPL
jgi:hypothetical protein